MKKGKKFEALRNVVGQICMVMGLLIAVVYFAVSYILPEITKLLGKDPLPENLYYAIIVAVVGFTLVFVLPCIIIININRDRDNLTKELKEITDKLIISRNIVEEIKGFSIVKEVRLIQNKGEFFRALNSARISASENAEIRLMNFANTIQEQEEEVNARRYYEGEIKFYLERKNVKLFRIVSIHTKRKFKECWELVKKARDNELDNFNLAYLEMDDFQTVTTPKITGVQVIDDVVILMDPRVARIDAVDHQNSILVRSDKFAQTYSPYHKDIWKKIESSHHQEQNKNNDTKEYAGHILYKKGKIAKDSVWREINQKMAEGERLKEKELEKMGIMNLQENCSPQEKTMKINSISSFFKGLFDKNKR